MGGGGEDNNDRESNWNLQVDVSCQISVPPSPPNLSFLKPRDLRPDRQGWTLVVDGAKTVDPFGEGV